VQRYGWCEILDEAALAREVKSEWLVAYFSPLPFDFPKSLIFLTLPFEADCGEILWSHFIKSLGSSSQRSFLVLLLPIHKDKYVS
jgi:hypothetical protein